MYFCRAKAEDCYLLPETSRTFKIDRASQAGKGKGFGQQNYWYAESAYARETLIPSVIDFLEANKQSRINLVQSNFEEPENIDVPLSDEEVLLTNNLFDSKNYYEFLPYGYRAFRFEEKADYAFYIADALCALHQYDTAIKWYQKVTEIEGKTWDIDSIFPYLYLQCEKYEDSIQSVQALFAYPEASKPEIKHEIYSIFSDNYYNLGNIKEAISYLDKILAESKDKALLEFTTENKNAMIALLS
jgi:tetratricopeptide (TPR) repeat protein